MVRLLCGSLIFTFVFNKDVIWKMSLFISADFKSIKMIGSLFLVVLFMTFDTLWTEKGQISLIAMPISANGIDGCILRITTRKDFSSWAWKM